METTKQQQIDPSRIMQVGSGFWASKTLLTAVNMELFTILSKRELSAREIQLRLGLHSRSLYDFLDALVALGFLNRRGLKETSIYRNASDTDLFLDKNKPSYIGGILEMLNNRLYLFWNDLEEGLKTGLPQNETKNGGRPVFEEIYADPKKLREFISAMAGVQMGNFIAFAKGFDFSNYKTLCDIGGSGGHLSAQVALNNSHMNCISFDLSAVHPVASENIKNMELTDRVQILSGDFFADDFPKADVITMGNILHDWGEDDKKTLIRKAYDALPQDGALVVIENIIDDNRSKNTFGLLMSLTMLIETAEGYDFTASDFNELAKQAGFKRTSLMPLAGPASAAIALK
jgi:O-methyltransferase/methyltransferase family protein